MLFKKIIKKQISLSLDIAVLLALIIVIFTEIFLVRNSELKNIIPKPVYAKVSSGHFVLTENTKICFEPLSDELKANGEYLSDQLYAATGLRLKVIEAKKNIGDGNILFSIKESDSSLGEEGYKLEIEEDQLILSANQSAGIFRGIQTIRQLLPLSKEKVCEINCGKIKDYPRYQWRGAMLDVARHFFGVDEIKRFIDLMSYYKMNRLHLHLTDDQGWRIFINARPKLTEIGGSSAVGGDKGGYYTQEQFSEIVAYAKSRYIMIVPEIDMPGHTNAALASYPELNPDNIAPSIYKKTGVGFSSLSMDKEETFSFIEDVIKEISAISPAPYIHIGGDEAHSTKEADYIKFIEHVQKIINSHGKRMIGWEEIAHTKLNRDSVVQYWKDKKIAQKGIDQGAKIIMSPSNKAYLDMKYDKQTPIGLNWAGYISVKDAYVWEPTFEIDGITDEEILGVEAPLWTETVRTIDDIEYMAFPRLIGIAEISWSKQGGRNWEEYRDRLAVQEKRLDEMGVNYYKSQED